jgi:[ribosomal protein S18]-alanine N-acetyltransferase
MRAAPELGVEVREARAGDEAFIRELAAASFREYDPRAAQTTATMMGEAGALTLLAERHGQALGFVILQPRAGGALAINAIAVAPSERGKRVGRRLMAAAERAAQARGLERLTLNTAQSNLAALDLFLRSGFVITARKPSGYLRAQPTCQLEKRL